MSPSQLEPAILVIFGITGDLSRRKVLPAIYHLFKDNILPEATQIVGTSRRELSVDDLLKDVDLAALDEGIADPSTIARFQERLRIEQLDPSDDAGYDQLKSVL